RKTWEAGRKSVRDSLEASRREAEASRKESQAEFLRLYDQRRGFTSEIQRALRDILKEASVTLGDTPSERNLMALGDIYRTLVDNADFPRSRAAARVIQDVYAHAEAQHDEILNMGQGVVDRENLPVLAAYIGERRIHSATITAQEHDALKVEYETAQGAGQKVLHAPLETLSFAMGLSLRTAKQELQE